MNRSRVSFLVAAAAVSLTMLLPVVLGRPSVAAPAARPQSLAVLIVSDGRTRAQLQKEEQMIALIHQSLDNQGLPREVLPILTYHTNRPNERAYCERTLNIRARDLVFLGLAQHQNQVVKKVILRESNVKNAQQAVARLFERAVAVLTGATPVATPTAPTTPAYTPTPALEGTRIISATLCRGVNAAGEPLERTGEFAPGDTFYVSCDIKGLRYGTQLEARWYGEGTHIYTGRLVSNRVGDYFAWFSMSPASVWTPGTYKVTLYIDGQQQATEFFRVNDRE